MSLLRPLHYVADKFANGILNSGVSFLWVLKQPHKDFGLAPLLLPDGFLEKAGDRGKVVQWSPQEQVLAHPAVAPSSTPASPQQRSSPPPRAPTTTTNKPTKTRPRHMPASCTAQGSSASLNSPGITAGINGKSSEFRHGRRRPPNEFIHLIFLTIRP